MSRVLVTGASAGLGLLTASSLARAGHEVILYARHRRRIEDADVLRRMWGVAYGDLGDLEEACRVAEEASLLGRLDSVVHNAGVLDGPDVLAVNVVGTLTPDLGHVESSSCWRKRDDQDHGQEELLR